MSTTTQDKTLNVIISARGNGRNYYAHDGDIIPLSISNEDYTYLKKTSGTLIVDKLITRYHIIENALTRTGIDTVRRPYCS